MKLHEIRLKIVDICMVAVYNEMLSIPLAIGIAVLGTCDNSTACVPALISRR